MDIRSDLLHRPAERALALIEQAHRQALRDHAGFSEPAVRLRAAGQIVALQSLVSQLCQECAEVAQ